MAHRYGVDDVETGGGTAGQETFNQEQVAAMIAVSSQIAQNGRRAFDTTCPYCAASITTETEITENEAAKATMTSRYTCVTVLLVVITLFCVAIVVVKLGANGEAILFGLGTGVVVALIFGCAMACSLGMASASNAYHDVKHSCPRCRKGLGVSDGEAAWKNFDNQRPIR